jgi:hypothetical protein
LTTLGGEGRQHAAACVASLHHSSCCCMAVCCCLPVHPHTYTSVCLSALLSALNCRGIAMLCCAVPCRAVISHFAL